MTTFERRVRRVVLLTDMAFVSAVVFAIGYRAAGGDLIGPIAFLVAPTFTWALTGHIGIHLLKADPETRRAAGRSAITLANFLFVILVLMLLLSFVAAPTSSGGMFAPEPANWLGLPAGLWVVGVGFAAGFGGRYWIHRILQDGREPESNDRFWWSRA